MPKRNVAVDVMKFIAALAITNSHMGDMYVHFSSLATGGAIGDAIFFFCSGFTLFLGEDRRFDNWYKRRIRRIYPAVLMWAIVTAFVLNESYSVRDCITSGGGWFVSCIMVYYIIIYFVRRFFNNRLWLALAISCAIAVLYYYLSGCYTEGGIYGGGTFRLVFFFSYMLLGAIIGKNHQGLRIKIPCVVLVAFLALYYALLMIQRRFDVVGASLMNLCSLGALAGICLSLYACCNSSFAQKVYNGRLGVVIKFIGGLCLEIYVVQHAIITTSLNSIFPLNLIVIFITILLAAYLLRCLSRMFLQTFQKEDYEWQEVFKL